MEDVKPDEIRDSEEFDVIGVQIGMRRVPVRSEKFHSVVTQIGEIRLHCFRAEMVDPAVNEGEAPSIMHVMIPADKVEMLIIEPKPGKEDLSEALEEVAKGNGGGVDDEEDLAKQRDRALQDEEDAADEHDGQAQNREGAVADRQGVVG